jgi:predicted MFS family arabinose efflux permease
LAGRLPGRIGMGPTVIVAGTVIGLGYCAVPLATPSTAIPMLVLFGLMGSLGGVIYNVNVRSLIQSITPGRMLGRTIATGRVVVWGTIPLGSFVGGILGSRIGLRPTLWVAAAVAFVAFGPPLLSPVRRLHEMPSLAPSDAYGPTR